MNWEVQVQTPSGQIKTVIVYNYNHSSDAKAAALAQTGAKRVIFASCFESFNHMSREDLDKEPEYFSNIEYIRDKNKSKDKDTIDGVDIFILICTIFFILTLISPILAIGLAALILFLYKTH